MENPYCYWNGSFGGKKPTIFWSIFRSEVKIFLPVFCCRRLPWDGSPGWGCMPWWPQGHWCHLVKRWESLRSDVKPKGDVKKPWNPGWDSWKRLGFFLCWKFLIGEWFECVGGCKRLVLKRHPWYGNFSNFEVNRSGAKVSSWIQSLGVMNDWMTERVAKTRVKEEEEVLVSFCRSPEMSQHLAVLLVSFLKVGWSFWTTYNQCVQTDFIESFQPGADGGRDH